MWLLYSHAETYFDFTSPNYSDIPGISVQQEKTNQGGDELQIADRGAGGFAQNKAMNVVWSQAGRTHQVGERDFIHSSAPRGRFRFKVGCGLPRGTSDKSVLMPHSTINKLTYKFLLK